jgi:uncharacterized protein YecT (DUF1311 family)
MTQACYSRYRVAVFPAHNSCGIGWEVEMLMRIWIWACLGSLVCVTNALAQSPEWQKCINGTTTNYDWSQCGSAEIKRQEARLNAAWKKAFACFDTEEMRAPKQDFLEEQRLWIKWKESSCNFYSDGQAFGREGQVLSYFSCRASVIAQRSEFLERFGKDCG